MNDKKLQSVRINRDVHRRLKVYAAENGLTIGKAIETLLRESPSARKSSPPLLSIAAIEQLLADLGEPVDFTKPIPWAVVEKAIKAMYDEKFPHKEEDES